MKNRKNMDKTFNTKIAKYIELNLVKLVENYRFDPERMQNRSMLGFTDEYDYEDEVIDDKVDEKIKKTSVG